jgi:hypothetical protein
LCVLYTLEWGKITVRFGGVNKPGRKLKAISEPFVWSEHRLNFNPKNGLVRAAGGQIISSFPRIRVDFQKTISALLFCEAMLRISAFNSPNPPKYELLSAALSALESSPNPWIEIAYGLKLLDLSGYGIARLPLPEPLDSISLALSESSFDEIDRIEWNPEAASVLRETAYHHLEIHSGEPLRTRLFRGKIQESPLQPVP